MKKLLILITIAINFGYSGTAIDYKPDFPIKNNVSGFNMNSCAWTWYPNNKELRGEDGVGAVWNYLSYYSIHSYTINLNYVKSYYDDDFYSIDVSYNTLPLSWFVNRNSLSYDSRSDIDISSTISYNSNLGSKFFNINYLLGFEYDLSQEETGFVNCLTLSIIPDYQAFEFYFSYFMNNKPSDDDNWLGFGINLFLEKK